MATTFSLVQFSILPSLCSFFPKREEIVIGSLYILGIIPLLARMICLCSNMNPPQHSPITMKLGFYFQMLLVSLIKNGFG